MQPAENSKENPKQNPHQNPHQNPVQDNSQYDQNNDNMEKVKKTMPFLLYFMLLIASLMLYLNQLLSEKLELYIGISVINIFLYSVVALFVIWDNFGKKLFCVAITYFVFGLLSIFIVLDNSSLDSSGYYYVMMTILTIHTIVAGLGILITSIKKCIVYFKNSEPINADQNSIV